MMNTEKEGQKRWRGSRKGKGGADLCERKRSSQSDTWQCDRMFKALIRKDRSRRQYEYNTK